MRTLEREQVVFRPRAEVFDFFSRAENLETITPKSLSFRILTPTPIVMQPGTTIDYELRLFGVPMRWQSLIEVFEPEERFVDVQLRGPYASWRHTHEFADAVGGGTVIRDRVDYDLPLGPLGSIAHALFVKRQLNAIFEHRQRVIEEMLGKGARDAGGDRAGRMGRPGEQVRLHVP